MNKLFNLFIILVLSWSAESQSPTELLFINKLNNSKNVDNKCHSLNELSRFYLYYNPSNALNYITKSINLSEKYESKELVLRAKINEAFYYLRIDNYPKAIELLEKTKKLAKNLNDEKYLGEIDQILARVYNGRGQYDVSMKLLLSAQEKFNQSKKYKLLGRIFETMGDINDKFGNSSLAIENLEKSIKFKRKYKDTIELSRSYSYLGNVYFREGQLEKSISYYDTAISLSKKYLNYNSLSYSYAGKARVYIDQRLDLQANELLEAAFDIAENQKNYWLMTRIYVRQSKILENANKIDSALLYAKTGLEISTNTNDDEGQSFCYRQLTNLYKKSGDYKNGFDALEKLEELENKILNNNISSIITTKELEFKNKLKVDQIKKEQEQKELILQKEKEADDKVLMVLIVLIISFLSFGIYITLRYRIERKQKKLIEKQSNENYILLKSFSKQDQNTALNEIASRIAHEVNSPLSAVQSSAQAILSLIRNSELEVLFNMKKSEIQLFLRIIQSDKSAKNYIGKERRNRVQLFIKNLKKFSDFSEDDIKEIASKFAELPYDIEEQLFKEIMYSSNPLNILQSLIIFGKIEYFSSSSFDGAQRISDKVNELKKYLLLDQDDSIALLNLEKSIQTVVDLFQYETEGKIDIHIRVKEDLEISFNSSKMYQIIYNILKNSVESFDKSITNPKIEIDAFEKGENIIIQIKNNGKIIPPESIDLIFEYFYTTKEGATGLGLSIVKNHLDSVNGNIEVESKHESTIFSISLKK